ncbi:EAL domain-containing protein [Aestuariispira insulae]|uniref:EAL domain-containing protein (Putative c-di-GMP-specific phosphodiesterase class I) n=1 Tax=Aestuariispira insulae TaxID=1461337 RepID=A0A3D9HNN4_9PROT|nr:EAL domain-containing protein [Aestuariispira insulae]RED51079.1 EAL domain-containing protein (putative c-di-GMP-specific phosphodiesterase class I) [Aestuariispira insulae]
MTSILTADGEIYEDEETLKRKFQLYVDVAGDILRGTGETERWLGKDGAALAGENLTHIIARQSLFLSSEIIFHAASGERLKPCQIVLKKPTGGNAGFKLKGEHLPQQDEFKLEFTQDPGMDIGDDEFNSVKGLANSVSGHLADNPDTDLDLTFVEIGDVEALARDMTVNKGEIDDFTREIEDRLRRDSISPDAVSRVENGKYGVVHENGADLKAMQQDLQGLAERVDPSGRLLNVATKTIELDSDGIDEADIVDAVEHAAREFADQGLDAIIFDTLSDSHASYMDKKRDQTEMLVRALAENLLTVAYQSVVDAHLWKTDHLLAEFRADFEEDGLGAEEILKIVSGNLELRAQIDEAQVKFISGGDWLEGLTVAISLDIHSLATRDMLANLLAFADRAGDRHVVLRIGGLTPEIVEKIDALKILQDSGFALALKSEEIGAQDEEKLKRLPADYVILDENLVSSETALNANLNMLIEMAKRCGANGKTLMFEGISSGEVAKLISKIPGSVASGPYFGNAIESFEELRYPMKVKGKS